MDFVNGQEHRRIVLQSTPFCIGRKPEKDLVIADPRVSRDHAVIVHEGGNYWLIDQGSKHGTFANGKRVERHQLSPNDRLEFGAHDAAYVIFHPAGASDAPGELLNQISELETSGTTDLEKLRLFLEAARKLNQTGVLEEVLVTLLDATLRLTRAERAYVFLRGDDGQLRLAAGRDSAGRPIADDSNISRSILNQAANAASEFLVSDTSRDADLSMRNSIVAFDLRTVICIPLLRTHLANHGGKPATDVTHREVRGVLYLDSRFASREFTGVSHDVLRAIATEAAALVENAHLAKAEQESRMYQQELAIAASIQQGLMAVTIPDVPYAKVRARSVACKDIGGDFYDVVATPAGLTVIVADVCGKGVSAALFASTLQGMIYTHLAAGMALTEVANAVNCYFCQKRLGEKYATLVMVQIAADGSVEYISCGHVPPVFVSNGRVERLAEGNLPVGLIPFAKYESQRRTLAPGDSLILISDGVTEAVDSNDDMFGDERLEQAAANGFEQVMEAVTAFCRGAALADDCTGLELSYTGQQQ
jgi:serine phosphatase RsbU (regulator of sigma subunit)